MDKPLKIIFISTLDNKGGAAKVSWMLGEQLAKRGHKVNFFVANKHSNSPFVKEIPKNLFYYRLNKMFADDLRFSRSDWILKQPEYLEADIVHCQNIHGGTLNWSTFGKIVRQKPVVWSIQDTWPTNYGSTTEYNSIRSKPLRVLGFLWDNRSKLLARKEKLYKNSFFHTVAPSDWMKRKIENSILGCQPCQLIYNCVDTEIFKPFDKLEIRKELGLPPDKKIILFVAPKGMNDGLKGSHYIQQIAKKNENKKDWLFVGIGNKDGGNKMISENIFDVGYIANRLLLAKYYSSADIFLYPSLADSFGLVVAEAMACGTPGAVFGTDGVPDVLGDEKCGYIAESQNVDDLEKGLNKILNLSKEDYETMRQNCISRAVNIFSLTKMTDEYLKLYYEILNDRNK